MLGGLIYDGRRFGGGMWARLIFLALTGFEDERIGCME